VNQPVLLELERPDQDKIERERYNPDNVEMERHDQDNMEPQIHTNRELQNRDNMKHKDYTVGWICALHSELVAAIAMLDYEHSKLRHSVSDNNLYTLGRIGQHNVVIANLGAGQTGLVSANSVAEQMRSRFRSIRFCLMVGIGGGVPSPQADIRLGDVVVSQPNGRSSGVVQYDFGRTYPDGRLERTGSSNNPPEVLLRALVKLKVDYDMQRSELLRNLGQIRHFQDYSYDRTRSDVLFKATYNHFGGPTCEGCDEKQLEIRNPRTTTVLHVHYGTIASGNQVIKDATSRDRISAELGGVLCFEMEAAGLMNTFPCLVIRGICDYADSHKNKIWQCYAAAAAAAYARELLIIIPATEMDDSYL